ncbi:S9 family peptidase [Paenibacillus lentus]|uniref:S9 family peptidase n=1 Tax=Paenibacillus lentus TaxID=1338368 RepID=A0A3Q8SD09_9BACL|nr:S9 family peptidase [Paenibacillus lentus]AZK47951.1 S9 family peptidase [Paenibacillus lentus]
MNKRPIQPEDLYGYQFISQPSISPSGTVAYVNQSVDRENNKYITHIRAAAMDGSGDQRLTDGEQDSAPQWSPDGSRLAFLRVARGVKQLHSAMFEQAAGSLHPVVQHTEVKHGVDAFVWSPDGRYIAFTSRVSLDAAREEADTEKTKEQANRKGYAFDRTTPKAEGRGWWDGLYTHLFVLELDSGNIASLVSGTWDISSPVWSPDSEAVSFVSKQPYSESASADLDLLHYSDVYTVRRSGGSPVKITDSSLLISQMAYSADGGQLALLASDRVYGSGSHQRLYVVSTEGGKPVRLAPELDMQLGNAALSDMKAAAPSAIPSFNWEYSPFGLFVLGTQAGCVHVYGFHADGSYRAVTHGQEKDVYQYTLAPDGSYLVVAALTSERPGELYRVDIETGKEQQLTRRNEEYMNSLQVRAPERFYFESTDGMEIHGWLLLPPGHVFEKKIPLILQIHGGPHAMYTGTFSHEMQTLAAQGNAVMWVNPRGSMGYGQYFAKACRGDFAGGDYRDLMEAVDELLSRYDFLDESRLGVTGGSYGGAMTNWIVAHTHRFRAAVTQRSISNWLSLYGTSDIGISYVEGVIGGNPAEHAELLWSRSPLAHAHRIETPLLILHGENDYRTPITQAEELYTTLKRYGKKTRLIRFPGSNHSLLKSGKPSLRVDSYNQVIWWFNQYLHEKE